MKKNEKKIEGLMIFGFLLLTLLFCLKGDMDTDLFWHMATGRWILENWQFPTEDSFSFVYNGTEWVNLTWIFQLATHMSMQLFGYIGVLLLCALLYMFSTFFSWLSFRSIIQGTPSFVVWVLYCVMFFWLEMRWVPRPEVWTHLFLSLEILILVRFCLKTENTKSLWLIPLIMIFWTNSHGMFILGLILFGFIFLRHPRKVLAPFLASLLATLINPYGWKGATYPFYLRKISADPIYRLIQEGMSFMDAGVSWGWYTMWAAWIILLFFSLRPGYRVMGWVYFLWASFAVYFSTTMVRNLSPSVLMTAPFILAGLESLWLRFSGDFFKKLVPYKTVAIAGITAIMCLLVISGRIEVLRENFHFGWSISENDSLKEAGDFLDKTTQEKIFASPEFNNYMLWRKPGFKTYIDTRYAEVVPRDHYQKMFQLFLNPIQIEQETVRYQLPVVAINHTLANYHGAIRYFLNSQNWRPVYADHFMIFFFQKSFRLDVPDFELASFLTFLKKEVSEWQNSSSWLTESRKIKKVYQTLVAATLFQQESEVLRLMEGFENKMDLRLNNLYCSILTYSSSRLPNESPNKRLWAQKASHICEIVYKKIKDQSSAYNRAAASFILGDLLSAQDWIERALNLNRTVFGFYLLKADILSTQDREKNFKEIEVCFKEALRLNPFQLNIWEQLILLQKKYGSAADVEESLQKAKKFYPQIKES